MHSALDRAARPSCGSVAVMSHQSKVDIVLPPEHGSGSLMQTRLQAQQATQRVLPLVLCGVRLRTCSARFRHTVPSPHALVSRLSRDPSPLRAAGAASNAPKINRDKCATQHQPRTPKMRLSTGVPSRHSALLSRISNALGRTHAQNIKAPEFNHESGRFLGFDDGLRHARGRWCRRRLRYSGR